MLPEIRSTNDLVPLIISTEQINDVLGHQLKIGFLNGYVLSIVANPNFGYGGRYAHGDEFEIAVFNPDGDFTQQFFPSKDDYVLGYVSEVEISELIREIAFM